MVSLLPTEGEPIERTISSSAERSWSSYAFLLGGGWLTLVLVWSGLGWLLTDAGSATAGIRSFDRGIAQDAEQSRSAAATSVSTVLSAFGDTLTVIGVAVVVGTVLLIVRHWTSVLLLTTALIVEVTVFVSVTLLIERDRPDVRQLDVSPPTSSFPSGHTAASTALALSLLIIIGWHWRSRWARVAAWTVLPLVGVMVALARVYRGMHFPSDVLAGFLLGLAAVAVAFIAVRAWVGEGTDSRTKEGSTDEDRRGSAPQEVAGGRPRRVTESSG
ncbi:MAG: phosphatase PAP2 family protein [Actinomycetes bacterium]